MDGSSEMRYLRTMREGCVGRWGGVRETGVWVGEAESRPCGTPMGVRRGVRDLGVVTSLLQRCIFVSSVSYLWCERYCDASFPGSHYGRRGVGHLHEPYISSPGLLLKTSVWLNRLYIPIGVASPLRNSMPYVPPRLLYE